MTLKDIKTQGITAKALLDSTRTRSYAEALHGSLVFDEFFKKEKDAITGQVHDNVHYLTDYIICAITSICDWNKRNNPMTEYDKRNLAEMIIEFGLQRGYTIEDVSLWAREVNDKKLPTISMGKEEYGLITVDGSTLYDKLKTYDRFRMSERNKEEEFRLSQEQERDSFKPLEPWMRKYDYEGHDMSGDPNWNPERYWRSLPTREELETIIWPRIRAKLNDIVIQF